MWEVWCRWQSWWWWWLFDSWSNCAELSEADFASDNVQRKRHFISLETRFLDSCPFSSIPASYLEEDLGWSHEDKTPVRETRRRLRQMRRTTCHVLLSFPSWQLFVVVVWNFELYMLPLALLLLLVWNYLFSSTRETTEMVRKQHNTIFITFVFLSVIELFY